MTARIILNGTSYHGKGAISAIVDEAKSRAFKKAFLCSDPDLLRFHVTDKITEMLDANGMAYEVYSNIKANPSIENVQTGVEAFKKSGADYIIAVGGGSSIDTAKAIGIIIANPEFEDVVSLEGVAPTKNPCVPIIAVPTTAGTGAEVTINYVITDPDKHRKFVCVDPHDIPVIAVIDPDMMASMPKGLTAATGMDALTHAIEGLITKAAWEMTDMFHLEAIKLIAENLRDSVEGKDSGRAAMALAQYITVMEYNAPATGTKYRLIAQAFGVDTTGMNEEQYRKAAVDAVRKLAKDVGIPENLKEIVKPEDVQFLAESAFADVCTGGNPRDTSVEEIAELYRSLLK